MDRSQSQLARWSLAAARPFAVVRVEVAEGSTPRESGAVMVVTADAVAGTIGGGRLEWDAIAAARDMMLSTCKTRTNPTGSVLDVPLGPAIGQCCGGRVRLSIRPGDAAMADALEALERDAARVRPSVIIYGAGHVGRALALALAPLPLKTILADTRPEELEQLRDDRVQPILASSLSDLAATAPDGSAHAVMTHSHALDSLIAATVLEQSRHRYLGLIGSQTKKTLFVKGFRELGLAESAIASVRCPIGGDGVRDKRPAVIAALAAAEIVTAMLAPS